MNKKSSKKTKIFFITCIFFTLLVGIGLSVFFLFPRQVDIEFVYSKVNNDLKSWSIQSIINNENYLNLSPKTNVRAYFNNILVGEGIVDTLEIQKRSRKKYILNVKFTEISAGFIENCIFNRSNQVFLIADITIDIIGLFSKTITSKNTVTLNC